MSKRVKCPCCGRSLEQAAARCSVCGMVGLDQIFLSRRDYKKWEKEVLIPHKAAWEKKLRHQEELRKRKALSRKQMPQIFGGCSHALILTGKGRLYGIGSRRDGQLGGSGTGIAEDPQLIADHVRSAALRSYYTIYVTEQGIVKLLGNGEYADRFQGFRDAQRVFSWNGAFWIQDLRGRWFGFGDNSDLQIAERTIKCIHVYYSNPFSINYSEESSEGPSPSPSRWEMVMSHFPPTAPWRGGDDCVRQSDDYKDACKRYGGANVDIEDFSYQISDRSAVSLSARDRDHFPKYQYQVQGTYSARIIVRNKHIYTPVQSEFQMPKASKELRASMGPFILLAPYADYMLGLKKTGEFCVGKRNYRAEDNGVKELDNQPPVLKKVKDFTISESDSFHWHILIVMEDGRVLYGGLEDFCRTLDKGCLKQFQYT